MVDVVYAMIRSRRFVILLRYYSQVIASASKSHTLQLQSGVRGQTWQVYLLHQQSHCYDLVLLSTTSTRRCAVEQRAHVLRLGRWRYLFGF